MESGGLHNVRQRDKELSIVNNLTGPTENSREKCSVDSMESNDEMGRNLSINGEDLGRDGGEKKGATYKKSEEVKVVGQNSLERTLGTFVHGLEENLQGNSKAACMELCNADLALNAEDFVTTILEATQVWPQAMLQNEVCKNNISNSSCGPLITGLTTLDKASQRRDIGPKYLSKSSSLGGHVLMTDSPKVFPSNLVIKDDLEESISRHEGMMHGLYGESGISKEANTGGIVQSSEDCRSVSLMKALDPIFRGKRCFEEMCIIDGDVTEAKANKGRLGGEVPNISVSGVAGQQPCQSP
jgi:hypothetical protein